MFDHLLRGFKDQLLAPLARLLVGVSPNALTVAACLVGVACAVAVAVGAWWLALALWIANRVLDGVDGSVARLTNRQTDLGGYLDILLDFVVYAAIPLGILVRFAAIHHRCEAIIAQLIALLEAAFFVNACSWMYLAAVLEKRRAGAAARGELTSVTMPPGLVAGTETVVFYAAFLFVGAVDYGECLAWLLGVMAALVSVTIVQRLIWAAGALGRR
jgi:phosphatidylglycerophosphate synthase